MECGGSPLLFRHRNRTVSLGPLPRHTTVILRLSDKDSRTISTLTSVDGPLFIFVINLFNPTTFIKHQIKHLVFPHQNIPKLFFLHQRYCL
jgi:hypothetical protein